MNPEVERTLRPLVTRVQDAETDLADVNSDPDAHPYQSLEYAGKVIKTYMELTERMWDLLDDMPPHTAEQWDRVQLAIHGRLNTLRDKT